MKISALTKFKNGAIYQAMEKLNWSQAELARRCGCNPNTIGLLINMRQCYPKDIVDTVQRVFGEHGIFISEEEIWPFETRRVLRRSITVVQTAEVDAKNLLQYSEYALDCHDHNARLEQMMQLEWPEVEHALTKLPQRQADMIKAYYLDGETYEKIAGKYQISGAAVQSNVQRGFSRMRDHFKKLEAA